MAKSKKKKTHAPAIGGDQANQFYKRLAGPMKHKLDRRKKEFVRKEIQEQQDS